MRAARHFRAAERWLERGINLQRALLEGIALGWLDRQALQAVTQGRYAEWKNFATPDYLNSGFQPWETRVFERFFSNCQRVLVPSAGAGRELIALEHLGARAEGCECSPDLAEAGREWLSQEGLASVLHDAEPGCLPATPTDMDAVLYDGLWFGWGGYMHIVDREARVEMLRQMRQRAVAGAPLLVSFLDRDEPVGYYYRTVFRLARLVSWLHPGGRRVELGDTLRHSFTHHFSRAEIEEELSAAGFQLIDYSTENYTHAIGKAAG